MQTRYMWSTYLGRYVFLNAVAPAAPAHAQAYSLSASTSNLQLPIITTPSKKHQPSNSVNSNGGATVKETEDGANSDYIHLSN